MAAPVSAAGNTTLCPLEPAPAGTHTTADPEVQEQRQAPASATDTCATSREAYDGRAWKVSGGVAGHVGLGLAKDTACCRQGLVWPLACCAIEQ